MAERAIILIPDISGFTGFTGATEIDHAAHIITELLELIVASNETDFTLAEIEGDAVLFYRKGEPLRREQLIDQCLRMFSNFHRQLMVIERDTVCQCGACQTASNLTLKFIVHFGYIKEIKVAQFVKATGIDMIVAHRLLKNDVDENEYILITEPCCSAVGQEEGGAKLQWAKSSQAYETIGNVGYEFATLTDYRAQIPEAECQDTDGCVRWRGSREWGTMQFLRRLFGHPTRKSKDAVRKEVATSVGAANSAREGGYTRMCYPCVIFARA
jgi:hypothetical protein